MQGPNTLISDYIFSNIIKNNEISVKYLPTDQMVADIFMKGLPSPRTKILSQKLGIY